MSQYLGCQHSLRQLLRLLVHDHRQFDDVWQEAGLRLWELFNTYDPTRPFEPWARAVVANVVRESNRDQRRQPSPLSPDAIAAILEGFERNRLTSASQSDQLEALEMCLEALTTPRRDLIVRRYHQDMPIEEIARQARKSIQATYKALQRIMHQLADCVRSRLDTKSAEAGC